MSLDAHRFGMVRFAAVKEALAQLAKEPGWPELTELPEPIARTLTEAEQVIVSQALAKPAPRARE
jgi:hypothetical protein